MAPAQTKTTTTHAAAGEADDYTTYVHADPSTFRELVQKLTGAPEQQLAAVTGSKLPPPPAVPSTRRAKLQERRKAMAPGKLQLMPPTASGGAYACYSYHNSQHGHHHLLQYSPVSTMDAFFWASSPSPSSSSSALCYSPRNAAALEITRKCEEEEEKAIASKGFYLHRPSPRNSAAGDGELNKPKLLPLFPVHSPRH